MYRYVILIALFTLLSTYLIGQSAHKELISGDREYRTENYSLAEDHYRKTWVNEQNKKGGFNLGNSIYQQGRYEEAIKQFQSIASQSTDPALKAKAFHNLGNAHFQNQAFQESIDAYKQSLKLNPQDDGTRKNLMMAIQKLREMQQQQQQQQQQDQDQSDEQEEQDQEEQQQQQQQQQQQEADSDQESQQQRPEEEVKDLSKEEAGQLLKIVEQEEQKVQEKLRKTGSSKKKPTKKW